MELSNLQLNQKQRAALDEIARCGGLTDTLLMTTFEATLSSLWRKRLLIKEPVTGHRLRYRYRMPVDYCACWLDLRGLKPYSVVEHRTKTIALLTVPARKALNAYIKPWENVTNKGRYFRSLRNKNLIVVQGDGVYPTPGTKEAWDRWIQDDPCWDIDPTPETIVGLTESPPPPKRPPIFGDGEPDLVRIAARLKHKHGMSEVAKDEIFANLRGAV